jgi:DNA-binding NarL/FixJ family response regulator
MVARHSLEGDPATAESSRVVPRARPLRVLLANLEPMTVLGMTQVLADEGIDVVSDGGMPGVVVAEARRLSPDAVVLGRKGDRVGELSAQIRAVAPDAKVIVWERDETAMEIFEPGSATPRRVDKEVRDALLTELGAVQANGEEE